MDCGEFKFLVHAYVDGEFDEREGVEAQHHVESCEPCRQLARHERMMRRHFKLSYEPDQAPEDFKRRLMARLSAAQEEEEAAQAAAATPPPLAEIVALPVAAPAAAPRPTWLIGPMAAAAAAAALLFVFWDNPAEQIEGASDGLAATEGAPAALASTSLQPAAQALDVEPIVEESVNWHRRNIPIEVTGPSNSRVSTWLKPKVNFPVRLPDFERNGRDGVSLLGARLSNIRERQAAYVVYEVDGNKISVMLFDGNNRVQRPAAARGEGLRQGVGRPTPAMYNANGYNVAVIENNGVTYSITSEMPVEDMAQLVDAAFSQ